MQKIQTVTKRTLSSYILAFSLLLLTLLVAACGSNAGSGSAGGTGSTGSAPIKASPTAVKGYGTAQGCPSDLVINTAPPAANVVVKRLSADASSTVAHVGDVIEVRLPFGHKWSGPIASSGTLQMQQPSGYAWKSDSVCIWRFVAKSAGTTTLNFTSRPLCKPHQMCPMYIAEIPLTITVK